MVSMALHVSKPLRTYLSFFRLISPTPALKWLGVCGCDHRRARIDTHGRLRQLYAACKTTTDGNVMEFSFDSPPLSKRGKNVHRDNSMLPFADTKVARRLSATHDITHLRRLLGIHSKPVSSGISPRRSIRFWDAIHHS